MAELGNGAAAIRCTACGFDNSPLSQYCQDCGAKLDPTAAVPASSPPPRPAGPPIVSLSQPRVPIDPPPAPQTAVPKPPVTTKKKPTGPRTGFPLASIVIVLFRTVVYGALAAVVIQLVRKPAAMSPPAARFQPEVAETARRKLQESARTGKPVHAPWGSINSYLATVLQPGGGSVKSVAFSRAAVAPDRNGFSLFTERKVLGLRLFSTISYRTVSRGGGTGIVATGAAIGRIPLPEWASGLVESSLGGLDTALYSELEILRNARKVDIGPDAAVIHFSSP